MSNEVEVAEIPNCDLCRGWRNKIVPAAFDGKTKFGPWANMCEDDFTLYGIGLGTGRGQRLIKREG